MLSSLESMALASGASPSDQTGKIAFSQSSFKDVSVSVLFDLIRGRAALIVFLRPLRNLIFVDYPSVAAHRLILALPYVLTSAGHQAVVIFFVLSGYPISASVYLSAVHIFMSLAIAAVTLAYARFVASAIEFHPNRVRHWIKAGIRRRSPSGQAKDPPTPQGLQ